MTPEQRRLRAQLAANCRWPRPLSREDQADAARAAIRERLERQVDPFGELPPDERERRVRAAARALSAKLNFAKQASTNGPVTHSALETTPCPRSKCRPGKHAHKADGLAKRMLFAPGNRRGLRNP